MGTRHLIAVKSKGDYKIAQYGQWDGYPSGAGICVLDFLQSVDLNKFKLLLDFVKFYSESELQEIYDKYTDNGCIVFGSPHEQYWKENLKHISRDIGSDILTMVYSEGVRKLKNSISFAGDSLFCEYAYVIDMDLGVFEVYEGFNKTPITEGRFLSSNDSLDKSRGYHPVKLVKTYDLKNLPTESQFIEDLESDEDEEE